MPHALEPGEECGSSDSAAFASGTAEALLEVHGGP